MAVIGVVLIWRTVKGVYHENVKCYNNLIMTYPLKPLPTELPDLLSSVVSLFCHPTQDDDDLFYLLTLQGVSSATIPSLNRPSNWSRMFLFECCQHIIYHTWVFCS